MIGLDLLAEYGGWALGLHPVCGPTEHAHRGQACVSPGKVPLSAGWQKLPVERQSHSIEPDKIAEEMANHLERGGNLGLVLPPGTMVLDADDEKTAATLAEVLPDAPLQRTARGAHLVVRAPRDCAIRNATHVDLGDGLHVDLRTTGGQIVVWPSIHTTGAAYEWERSLPSTLAELPGLPERFALVLAPKHEPTRSRRPRTESGARFAEGTRNASLFSLARSLHWRGLSRAATEAALSIENAERCDPPLDPSEVARIIESAWTLEDRRDFAEARA